VDNSLDKVFQGLLSRMMRDKDKDKLIEELYTKVIYYESLLQYHGEILLCVDVDSSNGGMYEESLCRNLPEVLEVLDLHLLIGLTTGIDDDTFRNFQKCIETTKESGMWGEYQVDNVRIEIKLVTEWPK
jgi:hypothetical protein